VVGTGCKVAFTLYHVSLVEINYHQSNFYYFSTEMAVLDTCALKTQFYYPRVSEAQNLILFNILLCFWFSSQNNSHLGEQKV
jgi:hypothetical protein